MHTRANATADRKVQTNLTPRLPRLLAAACAGTPGAPRSNSGTWSSPSRRARCPPAGIFAF